MGTNRLIFFIGTLAQVTLNESHFHVNFDLSLLLVFCEIVQTHVSPAVHMILVDFSKSNQHVAALTYFVPVFPFVLPWKHQKTFVFRGNLKAALWKIGLMYRNAQIYVVMVYRDFEQNLFVLIFVVFWCFQCV